VRRHKPKPTHLGENYAKQFQDESVVQAYQYRGPFPSEVFTTLLGLLDPFSPKVVLDIGCGRGEIARELVDKVDSVDAVDFSLPMIKTGKTLKNGNHPNLRWICCKAEEAPLNPPYTLITAGNSLHWMDWDKLMPIMESVLTPAGKFAIVSVGNGTTPWGNSELDLIREFSTNRDFKPYNLIDELKARELFKVEGSHETTPIPLTQTIDEYIESIHSRNGFSRERMTNNAANEFDKRIRELMTPYADGEILHLTTIASITWGRPTT
jgi:ubiquinone/menaquinone biosynthesis C-methylase UbiE